MGEMGMKTTQSLPQVDETLCTLCGLCAEACRCHAVKLGDQGPLFACPEASLGPDACPEASDCDCLCEEACPTGAISWAFEIVLEDDASEASFAKQARSMPGTDAISNLTQIAKAGGEEKE